jgi:hypothetical protein
MVSLCIFTALKNTKKCTKNVAVLYIQWCTKNESESEETILYVSFSVLDHPLVKIVAA